MSEIEKSLKDMKIYAAYPEKRQPGKRKENDLELLTNLTCMTMRPNIPFYKYDLRMVIVYSRDGKETERELTKQTRDDFPEQERKLKTVVIFKELIKTNSDLFGSGEGLFYDRAAILFSAKVLNLGAELKEFLFPPSKTLPDLGNDALYVKVTVKKCTDGFQVSSNDLSKVVGVRACEQDKEILEVLNLVISQDAFMRTSEFITYGSGIHYLYDPSNYGFRESDCPPLMDGKYVGIGVSKSVKILEGEKQHSFGTYVVTEVKKGAFHNDHESLLTKIMSMSIFCDPRTGSPGPFNLNAINSSQKQIINQLKKLYVRTTYGKQKRTFPIGNISDAANVKTMKDANDRTITIQQYFKKQYGIELRYPGLFTVSELSRPDTCYPVELLIVAESQRVTQQQQTPDQVAKMIKACATLPKDRIRQTTSLKEAISLNNNNSRLTGVGIKVDKQFTAVNGRVLPSPKIVYGGGQAITPIDNCKWNITHSKFYQPSKLENWAVLVTLTSFDARGFEAKVYISRFVERCRQRGMKVDNPAEVTSSEYYTETSLRSWFKEQKSKGRRYLLFITSDSIKQHGLIKLLETEHQILTQEIKASRAVGVLRKGQTQTLDNVVAKVNAKLGGLNHFVLLGQTPNAAENQWLNDKSRLIIGLEISNPPPLSQAELEHGGSYKMPSVLGWGANCTDNPQKYLGDYEYIAPRQSDMLGNSLEKLLVRILKKFRAATNVQPQHIVIYFSGVSEGQWDLIPGKYLLSMKKGIRSLSEQYKPKLTALALSKEHNERLYRMKINGTRSVEQNIPPGTVVDTKIVSPVINEFYLNAHSAFQGTTKTPKYSLLADDSNCTPDFLEGLTHGLCYLHEIITATVSLPVPLVVADRCAKRGHDIWITNSSGLKDYTDSIEEANLKLTNNKPNGILQNVRYNA